MQWKLWRRHEDTGPRSFQSQRGRCVVRERIGDISVQSGSVPNASANRCTDAIANPRADT